MEKLTDSQLITLYREAGNHKAFDGLVNRYSQIIYRFAYKLLNNRDEAHDVAQESFINAWKNIKRFDKNKNFKTWILAIARNKSIDIIRKRKSINFSAFNNNEDDNENNFEANIPDNELLPNELFEKKENIEIIQEALDTISIDNRIIILLYHGEEMTFQEISEILHKPMNTVKSQYRRTLIALKKYLSDKNAPK